jgi:23S rRNA (guanine745-N1)-methyltransferase
VNLLQPQDRRSPNAGDSKEVVAARSRLLQSGTGVALHQSVTSVPARIAVAPGEVVVDLGSGTGDALAALITTHELSGIGVDLSVPAAATAARSFPHLTWVVANADRQIPLLDHSVSLILSLHARRNPVECLRTLRGGGWLLIAVPAPDDLMELRAAVQGEAMSRTRIDAVIREHGTGFDVEESWTVRDVRTVSEDVLQDLLRITYRGGRRASAARIGALTEMPITLASDVVLFRRR